MDSAEIDRRFTYSPPDAQRAAEHEQLNAEMIKLAHWLNRALPEGREKSLAMTHLEDTRHWANKAIATTPRP